jgi:hypothetical protein
MADTNKKANDPQEEIKIESSVAINSSEGATVNDKTSTEEPADAHSEEEVSQEDIAQEEEENVEEEADPFGELSLTELVDQLQKRTNAQQWFTDGKNIQEIIHVFDQKFKSELQEKKEAFIDEGGNEIDFYFKPKYKSDFDQNVREYKKNKRAYYLEREQAQKLNLDRKLEIIERLKELINVDENINTVYKKFKNLQDSWHKSGPVPRAQSNNIWQTYKHHTEIFYDFLHLNRELRDLDFKHNYEEKIKIIEQAEALSNTADVLKASRDLNTLHRLWKNDLGPVAKEHRDELWTRFQAASQIIHAKREEFDKEYDTILENNLNKKNILLDKMEEIKNNPPQNHNDWRKTIDSFNKMRNEFQSIGQVTKKESKNTWNRFREVSREINREKNQFYKSQKAEQKTNIGLKKALINEVKEILEDDDWKNHSNRMKNIQKDWRAIGFVPRKLSNALWEEFRSQCNLYFDRIKTGYQRINKNEEDAHNKKEEFIERIKTLQIPSEWDPFVEFFNYQWEQYNSLGELTGRTHKKSIAAFNSAFSSVIDRSDMKKEVKTEAKNHLHFSLIKEDENELAREIQNIKKGVDELNAEARQLENNLDYFSNTSNNNPLFVDVTTKLNQLMEKIEIQKEKLIGLMKLKRALDAKNTVEENDSEEKGTTEEA